SIILLDTVWWGGYSREQMNAQAYFARTLWRARGQAARVTSKGRRERNVPFYQTNPPFFGGFFDGSDCECMGCGGNVRRKSVGSFWKTNPPARGFEATFNVKCPTFSAQGKIEMEKRNDRDA